MGRLTVSPPWGQDFHQKKKQSQLIQKNAEQWISVFQLKKLIMIFKGQEFGLAFLKNIKSKILDFEHKKNQAIVRILTEQ